MREHITTSACILIFILVTLNLKNCRHYRRPLPLCRQHLRIVFLLQGNSIRVKNLRENWNCLFWPNSVWPNELSKKPINLKIALLGAHRYEKVNKWVIFGPFFSVKMAKNASVKLDLRPIGALLPNLVTLVKFTLYLVHLVLVSHIIILLSLARPNGHKLHNMIEAEEATFPIQIIPRARKSLRELITQYFSF